MDQYINTKSVKNLPQSSRPKKLNERDYRLITQIIKKDPTTSAISLAEIISEVQQKSVSVSTI